MFVGWYPAWRTAPAQRRCGRRHAAIPTGPVGRLEFRDSRTPSSHALPADDRVGCSHRTRRRSSKRISSAPRTRACRPATPRHRRSCRGADRASAAPAAAVRRFPPATTAMRWPGSTARGHLVGGIGRIDSASQSAYSAAVMRRRWVIGGFQTGRSAAAVPLANASAVDDQLADSAVTDVLQVLHMDRRDAAQDRQAQIQRRLAGSSASMTTCWSFTSAIRRKVLSR